MHAAAGGHHQAALEAHLYAQAREMFVGNVSEPATLEQYAGATRSTLYVLAPFATV